MGVRTHVPFKDLTPEERHIVFDGPAVKKHIFYKPKNSNDAAELDFTYYSAVYTVENALSKVKDEKGMKRVEKFLKEEVCPECGGTRLSPGARAPRVRGDLPGPGLPAAPFRPGGVGPGCARLPAGGAAPHGGEHLPILPEGGPAAAGVGALLPLLGPGGLHPFHRGAPADAAGPGGAQPDHRRPLCAGRALHRPAPPEHRRPCPSAGRPGGRRELGGAGGPRHPPFSPRGLGDRDGPRGWGRRRPGDRPGHGGRDRGGPPLPDRPLPGGAGQGAGCARPSPGRNFSGWGASICPPGPSTR